MNIRTFLSAALLAAVGLAQSAVAQELKGVPADGQRKAQQCIGCHGIGGYKASFPEIYHVPMIAGQNPKYLVAAMSAYKRGERKHPSMRGVVDNLSDQDMADLAAYYAGNGRDAKGASPAEPSAAVAALLNKGGCKSCHGDKFANPIDPAYPKIAGQHADYLSAALRAYKVENGRVTGRGNPIMGGVIKQFSNAELKQMADYLATLPSELQTLPQSPFHTK